MTIGLTRLDLADSAAAAILAAAREQRLRKGDFLPPVTTLAGRLGVSRAVVRGALAKLAAKGSIERDGGRRWRLRSTRGAAPRTGPTVVPHTSLADQAAMGVLELIRSARLKEGDTLPSSRELAERFGVSILVMREAFVELEARGILDRRQGRESVVAVPSHDLISSILSFRAYLDGIDAREFQSCRAGLEIRAAELAAASGDPDERRRRLEPLLQGMRRSKTEAAFNEYDLAFHLTIAHLSGNRAIEMLLASLNDLVRSSLAASNRLERARAGRLRGLDIALKNHERIAAAIVRGDERAAARAMDEHFQVMFASDDR